ncbi:MAG: ABC transporter permease [Actinomycetaceae bacterium]|nr:ABC transporter permease [Actinomycetaceae bacterium]
MASSAQAAGVITRVSLKFPLIFQLVTVLLVFFAASAEGQTKYDLNAGGGERARALVKFDLFYVDARVLCLTLAVLCALATVHAFYRVWMRMKISALSAFVAGASIALGILTWYGADSRANVTLTATLAGGLVLAVPMIYGSMAGIVSERVGVVNIAIEGQLLVGAFAGVVVASATKSVTLGLAAAPAAGALLGSLLAFFAIKYNIDQIIIGVVLNVLALGLTSFFFQAKLEGGSGLNSSAVHLRNIRIPLLADIPIIGPILFKQTLLTYFMYALVAFLTVYLFRSRWGLRLRACGEHPKAAATVGIDVRRTRFLNTMLSGAIAGLGGAFLTIGASVGQSFNENMSAGRGYIALAAMILGRWHPIGAVGAALVFGLSEAMATLLKSLDAGSALAGYFSMLPYVITILAVAGFVGRSRPPAAENTPYEG